LAELISATISLLRSFGKMNPHSMGKFEINLKNWLEFKTILRIQQQVGASNYVYASGSRKRCIEELRELVDRAREYSYQIPSEVPSIDEFIEEDLRLLAKIDEEILPEHLDFKAMKALWQFM
jgi:hypothetical protein